MDTVICIKDTVNALHKSIKFYQSYKVLCKLNISGCQLKYFVERNNKSVTKKRTVCGWFWSILRLVCNDFLTALSVYAVVIHVLVTLCITNDFWVPKYLLSPLSTQQYNCTAVFIMFILRTTLFVFLSIFTTFLIEPYLTLLSLHILVYYESVLNMSTINYKLITKCLYLCDKCPKGICHLRSNLGKGPKIPHPQTIHIVLKYCVFA